MYVGSFGSSIKRLAFSVLQCYQKTLNKLDICKTNASLKDSLTQGVALLKNPKAYKK